MKQRISDTLESPFFFGLAFCGALLFCEASILIPWALGVRGHQDLVNVMLTLVLVCSPSASMLSLVRPDIGQKSGDVSFLPCIGRMYNNYYTVGFRVGYSMLNILMLVLVITKVSQVFDRSLIEALFVASLFFTAMTFLLCALYRWAIKGTRADTVTFSNQP